MHIFVINRSESPHAQRMIPQLLAMFFACIAMWLTGAVQAADDANTLEYRVKAEFLHRFAGYVEWPQASFSRSDTPITIAVAGAEPVAADLTQAVSSRTVNGRTVEVKRLKAGESLAGVHILFVGKTEYPRLGLVLQNTTQPRPILVVTESEGALAQGSMINFLVADRRVRFEIALDTAEKNGLKLSSRLLAVAQDVRTEGK